MVRLDRLAGVDTCLMHVSRAWEHAPQDALVPRSSAAPPDAKLPLGSVSRSLRADAATWRYYTGPHGARACHADRLQCSSWFPLAWGPRTRCNGGAGRRTSLAPSRRFARVPRSPT